MEDLVAGAATLVVGVPFILLVIWAIIEYATPKRVRYNCDECGNLIKGNAPLVRIKGEERVDFCSKICEATFLSKMENAQPDVQVSPENPPLLRNPPGEDPFSD